MPLEARKPCINLILDNLRGENHWMVDLNDGKHNLLDQERASGLTVNCQDHSKWSAVCSTSVMLPEIDAAGLDVCFDDGDPAVLVYAECNETEWKNGVEALKTIAKMHDTTIITR